MLPWGTPEVTGDHSEAIPSTITRCFLPTQVATEPAVKISECFGQQNRRPLRSQGNVRLNVIVE